MARFKKTRERLTKLSKDNPEELARELNIILRSTKYETQEEVKAAIKRCAERLPKEFRNILLGK